MMEHGGSTWVWPGRRVLLLAACLAALAAPANAQAPALPSTGVIDNTFVPALDQLLPAAKTRQQVSASLKILIVMTVLSLAPAILMMTTSFTRIMIVLALLRQGLGTQQLPPSQVLVGISLFLTFLIMAPTYEKVYSEAVVPWLDEAPGMTQQKALAIADQHLRNFMFAQIEGLQNEEEVFLFLEYAGHRNIPVDEKVTRAQVPTRALIPAFMLSEIKAAFVMGFKIYLPFLVIDMVIAAVLVSMGMLMLPPVLISLPFKLLLFVLADGWHLVVTSLLHSYT